MQLSQLREIIRELIRRELSEISVTGNIDGGEGPPKTPYAFSKKKEKDEDDLKLSAGMSLAEMVKENYWHYRNDDSLSTKQKLAKSLTLVPNLVNFSEILLKATLVRL